MLPLISQFLSGGIMVGFMAIGLFFFQFWRRTQDRLFAAFAASFWVLAAERVLLLFTAVSLDPKGPVDEIRPYIYFVRLFAFLLIIGAFFEKNRRAR